MNRTVQLALLGSVLVVNGCSKQSQVQLSSTSSKPSNENAGVVSGTFDGTDTGCARLGREALDDGANGWDRKDKILLGVYHNSAHSRLLRQFD